MRSPVQPGGPHSIRILRVQLCFATKDEKSSAKEDSSAHATPAKRQGGRTSTPAVSLRVVYLNQVDASVVNVHAVRTPPKDEQIAPVGAGRGMVYTLQHGRHHQGTLPVHGHTCSLPSPSHQLAIFFRIFGTLDEDSRSDSAHETPGTKGEITKERAASEQPRGAPDPTCSRLDRTLKKDKKRNPIFHDTTNRTKRKSKK